MWCSTDDLPFEVSISVDFSVCLRHFSLFGHAKIGVSVDAFFAVLNNKTMKIQTNIERDRNKSTLSKLPQLSYNMKQSVSLLRMSEVMFRQRNF